MFALPTFIHNARAHAPSKYDCGNCIGILDWPRFPLKSVSYYWSRGSECLQAAALFDSYCLQIE